MLLYKFQALLSSPLWGKRRRWGPLALALMLTASISSCSTVKQVEIVKEVSRDTIYLNRIQYDSIYIQHEKIYEPVDTAASALPPFKGGPGRVLESHIEYRYKLLKDTVRIVQIDSIPVIKTVKVSTTRTTISDYLLTGLSILMVTLIITIIFRYIKNSF